MINKFVWKDSCSVGIASIDDQHKHFFSITNDIISLLEKGNTTKEELCAMVLKLEDYADFHFKTEEGYFDHLHYRDAPFHIDAHYSYCRRVAYYRQELEKSAVDLPHMTEEVATYSIYWLSDHILRMDKHYTIFFKEHGVK
jgi:hemerythrin